VVSLRVIHLSKTGTNVFSCGETWLTLFCYQNFSDIYEKEASKTSFQMQLKLALAWNRIDVAKSEIFGSDLKNKKFEVCYLSTESVLMD